MLAATTERGGCADGSPLWTASDADGCTRAGALPREGANDEAECNRTGRHAISVLAHEAKKKPRGVGLGVVGVAGTVQQSLQLPPIRLTYASAKIYWMYCK